MTQNLVRVTSKQAQLFLSELANLSDNPVSRKTFERRFAHILPRNRFKQEPVENLKASSPLLALIDPNFEFDWLAMIRLGLQNIWRAPDPRTRAWGAFRLVDAAIVEDTHPLSSYSFGIFSGRDGQIVPLPLPTPFEDVFDYLRSQAHRLAYCGNGKCPNPYFFSVRSSQKYCSVECAWPSQCEFKKRWWAKNGKYRRRKRA